MVAVQVTDFCETQSGASLTPELRLVPDFESRARLLDSANDRGPSELQLQRRRLGAVAIALTFCLALLWAASGLVDASSDLGGGSGAATVESTAAEILPATHTVLPGDTLWGIMRERFPTSDIRGRVDALARQIGGDDLSVGQIIVFDELVAAG